MNDLDIILSYLERADGQGGSSLSLNDLYSNIKNLKSFKPKRLSIPLYRGFMLTDNDAANMIKTGTYQYQADRYESWSDDFNASEYYSVNNGYSFLGKTYPKQILGLVMKNSQLSGFSVAEWVKLLKYRPGLKFKTESGSNHAVVNHEFLCIGKNMRVTWNNIIGLNTDPQSYQELQANFPKIFPELTKKRQLHIYLKKTGGWKFIK